VCDGAAGSYMEPGMEAIRSTLISFDDIVYNNQDKELVEFALFALDATQFLGIRNRFDSANVNNPVAPFNDGDIVTIGEVNTCISADGFTVRLWQLDSGDWVFDTITSTQAVDMTSSWPDDIPNPQTPGEQLAQPQFPVLVDGVLFRYLLPYIEPPITTVPSTGEVTSGGTVCEGTPPSFLSIGMEVVLDGYGYEQFPQSYDVPYQEWTFDNTRLELNQHGFDTYTDILNTTPLTGIVGNIESVVVSPQDLYANARPEGVVLNGPFCIEESVDPAITSGNVTEASDPAPERFALWWQVEVNGQVGWYPENVGQFSWWLWETDGMFARKLSLYYMIPNEQMMTTAPTCPPVGLFAGQTVQPAARAMNLRATPNGDVIGRVDVGQPVSVFGEPTCEGGANWWQTDRGGFIAENDPDSGLPLLVQYVPPVVTEEPVQTNPVITAEPAQPGSGNNDDSTSGEPERPTEEPPREPERPMEDPSRGPERPTEEPPREPERPMEDPSRGPERPTEEPPRPSAPIIAQPVNPTTPPR
jgi:hypothetical protein